MADVTTPFGFPYPESTDLVRDGATDIEALAQAANDQFSAGFQFAGQRIYTSSGLFAKADPFGDSSFDGAKLRAIRVRCLGAGGGGGGAGATTAGQVALATGGGGGGFAESFITDIAGLATTVTVTRGGGGAGGSGATFANGSVGGATSFGALVVAAGGRVGNGRNAVTFAAAAHNQFGSGGGSTNTGDLTFRGGSSAATFCTDQSLVATGLGGGTVFTPMPPAELRGAAFGAGIAGVTFGLGVGGGGGGNTQNQATARDGGAGANGIVIVDVFA